MCLHQCHQQLQQQNEHLPFHRPPQERQHADYSEYFVRENITIFDYELYGKIKFCMLIFTWTGSISAVFL